MAGMQSTPSTAPKKIIAQPASDNRCSQCGSSDDNTRSGASICTWCSLDVALPAHTD
jgi:hypothetical protein